MEGERTKRIWNFLETGLRREGTSILAYHAHKFELKSGAMGAKAV